MTFAADVLRNLLHRIDDRNRSGHEPYVVSHAWTDGPMLYLVFSAPPSDRTWGLARDTRTSLIDPGPWPDAAEAGLLPPAARPRRIVPARQSLAPR